MLNIGSFRGPVMSLERFSRIHLSTAAEKVEFPFICRRAKIRLGAGHKPESLVAFNKPDP